MKRIKQRHSRLTALGLLLIPLLTYPILTLVKGTWAGLPLPFLYLFLLWSVAIALAAWFAEREGN